MWDDDEKDRFYKQLTVLAETLGEPMTPVRLAGYCSALEDVPLATIAVGMREAMRSCRYFPRPVEIRELALQELAARRVNGARRVEASHRLAEPRLSDEEIRANLTKLAAAVKGLAARRRMR